MGILTGNQKDEPMHYGEVFAVWTNLAGCYAMVAAYQTLYNHAGDDDLRKLLGEFIRNAKDEVEPLERILKSNGVALPLAPPERPEAKQEHIPPGAKINDPEISATLSVDAAKSLSAYSNAMGICTREDIAMMFGQFHLAKAQLAYKLLRLNKTKGWLMLPPLHFPI